MTCDFWGAWARRKGRDLRDFWGAWGLRRDFWVLGPVSRELRRDFWVLGPGERAVTCDFWGAWARRKGRDL